MAGHTNVCRLLFSFFISFVLLVVQRFSVCVCVVVCASMCIRACVCLRGRGCYCSHLSFSVFLLMMYGVCQNWSWQANLFSIFSNLRWSAKQLHIYTHTSMYWPNVILHKMFTNCTSISMKIIITLWSCCFWNTFTCRIITPSSLGIENWYCVYPTQNLQENTQIWRLCCVYNTMKHTDGNPSSKTFPKT